MALPALLLAAPAIGLAADRDRLDIRLFARVPNPGQPEPIAIGPDRLVYVATNQLGRGDIEAPSEVFAFRRQGRLLRSYAVRGQDLGQEHGIQGLAFDGSGLLYLLDRAARARVVVLNPISGRQRDYATFPDVPPCGADPAAGNCSATQTDAAAEPDYAAFAPDGTLYVTDIEQALIYRVPRGGGEAEVWFTDPRLESIFGPNGIQLMADRRTLLFANTGSPFEQTRGALYELPIEPDGASGELVPFWTSQPADGPDGFAIAGSGNVYVALAGASQIALISPQGTELARAPADPVENLALEVPVDAPGSAAFLGERLLVTNHSAILGNPSSWAILDVFAGEAGLPLHYPVIAPRPRRPRIKLSASPKRALAGAERRFRFRARVGSGPRSYPASGARIRVGARRLKTNRRGRASTTIRIGDRGRREAVARRRGLRPGRAAIRSVRRPGLEGRR
jgi:sugar lactone lactonase YvrE